MLDADCIVSNHQSLAVAAGAILSTYSYDLGAAGTPPAAYQAVGAIIHDVGRGYPVQALARVSVTFDSAGDGVTCKCALVMADNAALDSNLTVLSETAAIAQAVLLAGYQFRLGSIPVGITKRYIGFRYTTAVEDATVGSVFAGFVPGFGQISI
jgi:hypothetical protein